MALSVVDEQYRIVTFNGTAARSARAAGPYLFNYVPIRDAEGGISRVVVSTYDMTAHRMMRDQNRDLAVAIEQSPVSVVVADTNGAIGYVNARMEETSGYSRDELIGRDPSVFTEMWDSISRGKVWQGEMVNRRKDGSLLMETEVIAPVVDDTGAVVRYIGLMEDLTDERKMQRALHDSKERYRILFETASVGILICNADGVVDQANEALGAIFGIPELANATHFRASSLAPLVESGLHDTLRDVMEQDRTVYREADYNLTDEHTITLR